MTVSVQAALSPTERRLLGLLASGQTLMQAAGTLRLAPPDADALLADLLHRHGLTALHQLVARALLYRWV